MAKAPTLPEILAYKNRDISANILRLRHIFMRKYGWISDEEFRKIKIPIFLGLILEIEREMREEIEAKERLRR